MTYEESKSIYKINQEIKIICDELNRLEKPIVIKAITYSGMPHSKNVSDPMRESDKYLDLKETYRRRLLENLNKLYEEKIKMENFLFSIQDPDVRNIARLRCVDNLKWEQIGYYMNMDRRTASRKFHALFCSKKESCPQCPRT